MSRKSPKKYKIYKYNYTCNRLPKINLLKKSSEIEFSSGDILTSKKSRFQRILNRVRGKKKREISPSYFITPWSDQVQLFCRWKFRKPQTIHIAHFAYHVITIAASYGWFCLVENRLKTANFCGCVGLHEYIPRIIITKKREKATYSIVKFQTISHYAR